MCAQEGWVVVGSQKHDRTKQQLELRGCACRVLVVVCVELGKLTMVRPHLVGYRAVPRLRCICSLQVHIVPKPSRLALPLKGIVVIPMVGRRDV